MQLINYGDKKVYCTGAKKHNKDWISIYKGIYSVDCILCSETTEEIEKICKSTKEKIKLSITDIVDLFCYGDITELNNIPVSSMPELLSENEIKKSRYFISDWSKNACLTNISMVKLNKDCFNKFGVLYSRNRNITLLPSVRLIKPDIITFGLYSPDTNKAVVEAYIWDISNNGITDKENYYNKQIFNKLEQSIK